jgi:hypothetical protein
MRNRNQFQSSPCGDPVFPAAFVEEAVFSFLCDLGSFVTNPLAIAAWDYVWVF